MKKIYQGSLFFTLIFSIYVFLAVKGLFVKLRVPIMTPTFGDLRLITSTAECVQNDLNWSLRSSSCDPWNRPFNLPSIWAELFAFLDLTESKTTIIGYLFIALFSLAATYWFYQFINFTQLFGVYRLGAVAALLLLFISPPVLLLVERGNVDVLIFVGTTFSVYLLKRNGFTAAFLVTLLGGLKLFPLAGLLIVVRRGLSRFSLILIGSLILVFGRLMVYELSLIRERSTTDFNGISFGVSVFPGYILTRFKNFEAFTLAHMLGMAMFFLFVLTYHQIFSKSRSVYLQVVTDRIKASDNLEGALVLVASVFLGAYLVGTSYDYRLVFIIPLLVTLSVFIESKRSNLILGCFGFLILYNSYWFSPTIGIVSDLALMVFTPLIAYLLFQLLRKDSSYRLYRH
jgi:hypothetical protein